MQRAHLFISGRVQGIGFRSGIKKRAESLGLSGWVRNLPDGRLEAVFEGPKDKLDQIITWCHQGPIFAKVNKVEIFWEEPELLQEFEVRY